MADSIKFIKIPGGPFMAKTASGLQTIADQRTLQGLSTGQVPYTQEELGSNVVAPSTYSPELTPNMQPQQQPSDLAPQTPDSTDPITKFNLMVLNLLRDAQKGGGQEAEFTNQRALERASVNRGSDLASVSGLRPQDMVSSMQNRANIQAPEQDAIAVAMKSQDKRLENFESMLSTIKDIGGDMLKNVAPSPEITTGYVNMIRAGADFTSIPEEIRNKIVSKLTPDDWNAWNQAKATQKAAERAPINSNMPTSYDEWSLAGGQEGTGKSYAQFIESTSVKPANQTQYTVAGYANRMEQANVIIDQLESKIATHNPATYAMQTAQLYPNYLKSGDIQSIEQAERNFVNAILRRESGAAIAPSEFESAQRQYFPMPGDKKDVLEQKRQNRLMSIQGLVNAAGSAYEPAPTSSGGVVSTGTTTDGSVVMTSPDGKKYKVPADKVDKFKANGYK